MNMLGKKVISRHRICLSCRNTTELNVSNCLNCGVPFQQLPSSGRNQSRIKGWFPAILLIGFVCLAYYANPEIRATVAGWWHAINISKTSSATEGREKTEAPEKIAVVAKKIEQSVVAAKEIELLLANDDQIIWRSQVRNDTTDTITKLGWRIEIYDPLRQLKVDELHVTQADVGIIDAQKQVHIPPGGVAYFISQLVNVERVRWGWRDDYKLKISLEDYTSLGR
jgi:hypothetical protein